MTNKSIDELRPGDFIADMHDGVQQLHKRFTVVSHIRWEEPAGPWAPSRTDGPTFAAYLHSVTRALDAGIYGNKGLVMIDWEDSSTLSNPAIVCGYCYDGRRSGLIVLRRKEA